MTSQQTGSPPPAIVWDKSRLYRSAPSHPQHHAVNGHSHMNGHDKDRKGGAKAGTDRQSRSSGESDLTMSFDPMKDLHLWTMWRVAVNGRIVDETRRRTRVQQANQDSSMSTHGGVTNLTPFGQALTKRPLDRFIKIEDGSQVIAGLMMDPHGEGNGQLGTQQFVFYGVPRVVLGKKPRENRIQLP